MPTPNVLPLTSYQLQTTNVIQHTTINEVGSVYIVNQDNFPALEGITCYTLEVWEECMRLPHWHPNAAELGYVIAGTIEVLLWRTPGETAVFTLGPGMCWFIPKAALHSLNNVGKGHAKLLVGFSSSRPQDIDLPVAFNGIPVPIRETYTSPHAALRHFVGPTHNPLLGQCQTPTAINELKTASPYGFDLAQVTPLFDEPNMGSVVWGVKNNWPILDEISILRARLKPHVARDPIWYPDAGTLYIVSQGKAEFSIIMAENKPKPFIVSLYDYIFVPMGVLHTFTNHTKEDFEITAFFTHANPIPEVSLSVATSFFPKTIRNAALTQYGNEHNIGKPLDDLNDTKISPYLLKVSES